MKDIITKINESKKEDCYVFTGENNIETDIIVKWFESIAKTIKDKKIKINSLRFISDNKADLSCYAEDENFFKAFEIYIKDNKLNVN